ncbi:MAG: thiol--disulfide interchange protein DsbA [Pseudomonadota bacterium]|jgi:thiol:disulfide interchange protein DsbA
MIRAGFASILMTLFASIALQAAPKLGTDFGILDSPLPIKKDGKVEVVEAFWYGCGHCYSFEPTIEKWSAAQGDGVVFSKLPVTWGPFHQTHAKLFYTIEALGISDIGHRAVFTAIHKEGNNLGSDTSIISFLKKLGVSEEDIVRQMNSFFVRQKTKRAIELTRQLKVTSVPMMFVDGKYRVEAQRSNDYLLEIVDHLIELQKEES